jgi:hypothetical protein
MWRVIRKEKNGCEIIGFGGEERKQSAIRRRTKKSKRKVDPNRWRGDGIKTFYRRLLKKLKLSGNKSIIDGRRLQKKTTLK